MRQTPLLAPWSVSHNPARAGICAQNQPTRILAREVCPFCHHPELVEGKVRGGALVYFVPKKTKFWTFKDSFVDTTALMCTRCGAISWFGDTAKLSKLRLRKATEGQAAEKSEPEQK